MEKHVPRYTTPIQWSATGSSYIGTLPEWGPYCSGHGSTYDEAAKNDREILELLLGSSDADSTALTPLTPNLYRGEASLVERFVNASRENVAPVSLEKQTA